MNKLYIKDGVVLPKNKIKATKIINGNTFVVYNPNEESILEDGWVVYNPPAPTPIEPNKEDQYKQRVIDLIKEIYSIDDELAILRQRDTKVDQFNAYNIFVEECKVTARREIYGDEFI